MHSQKFINTYIFLGVILSICLAKFLWGWIDIEYTKEFEIPGEYSEYKYNPLNENIKYVTFISLPLIVYLACIKIFRKHKIKGIKEIIFYDNKNRGLHFKLPLPFHILMFCNKGFCILII